MNVGRGCGRRWAAYAHACMCVLLHSLQGQEILFSLDYWEFTWGPKSWDGGLLPLSHLFLPLQNLVSLSFLLFSAISFPSLPLAFAPTWPNVIINPQTTQSTQLPRDELPLAMSYVLANQLWPWC